MRPMRNSHMALSSSVSSWNVYLVRCSWKREDEKKWPSIADDGRNGPSDTDGVISGNKITCIAICAFYTGNFALFQLISTPGRAKSVRKGRVPAKVSNSA